MTNTTSIFTTTRTIIRKLQEADFPAFWEMQSSTGVMEFVSGVPQTMEECRTDFDHCLACYKQPDNEFWVWAVAEKTSGDFLGTVAVVRNDKKEHEIGYRLLEKFWGKGFGRESANGLIDHCLHNMQLPEIVAYVDVRNTASVKILDRSKMELVWEKHIPETEVTDRFYRVRRSDG